MLANGSDHLPIEPELPKILAELERTLDAPFRIGRYDEHAPAAEGLPVHEGELVGSRLQNILRGVNSARIYLKQANERAERRLLSIETAAALRTLRDDARVSRPPTCGSRGATSCATTRTTRSAAARATRCTGTCSSATSSSTGRSTMSSARRSASAARS